jgi:hypothetical protein
MVTLSKPAAHPGMATAMANTVTKKGQNNDAELESLEIQVRKTRQLVRQCELKVEAIEASIQEIEKFQPKIKIVRSPARLDRTADDGFRLVAEKELFKAT